MSTDTQNILERLSLVEKSLQDTISFIYKDDFSNQKIFRKKVDFTEDVKFSGSKIAFFNVTKVVQQTDIGVTTLGTVSGTGDDTTINSNFAVIAGQLDSIRTVLRNLGLMK